MSVFRTSGRRLLSAAALITATALIGCTTVPAPTYTTTTYAYPPPYYSGGYSVTTTNYPEYPLYSPYYKGYGVHDADGNRG